MHSASAMLVLPKLMVHGMSHLASSAMSPELRPKSCWKRAARGRAARDRASTPCMPSWYCFAENCARHTASRACW